MPTKRLRPQDPLPQSEPLPLQIPLQTPQLPVEILPHKRMSLRAASRDVRGGEVDVDGFDEGSVSVGDGMWRQDTTERELKASNAGDVITDSS